MDGLQNPSQEVIDTVQNSLATGVPAITNDGVQDMIDSMGGGIAKLPPQKNPRDDFMSIGGVGGNDGILEDRFTGEERGIPRKPFIAELPPIPPKRDDFMSIERLGGNDKPRKMPPPLIVGTPNGPADGPAVGGGPIERFPISVGVPGTDMFKQYPIPGQTPTIIDEIPRPKVMAKRFSAGRGDITRNSDGSTSVNGVRQATPFGGGVNKALEELRNRLR